MRTILVLICATLAEVRAIDTVQSEARKGHLFVYTLHSASFFPSTGDPSPHLSEIHRRPRQDETRFSVEVTWSATLKNRPALPSWLHLVPSRHKAIAYLVGTKYALNFHYKIFL